MSASAEEIEARRLRLNAKHREWWANRTDAQKARKRELSKKLYPKRYPKKQARRKAQRAINPEHFREQRRRYYLKAKDKEAEAHRAWVARNRHRMNELNARRRALRVAASINLAGIQAFVASVKGKKTVRCYYCDSRIATSAVHFDHIIPLSKGGQHSVDNLCVSCEACNTSKGAKPLSEWARVAIPQQLLCL